MSIDPQAGEASQSGMSSSIPLTVPDDEPDTTSATSDEANTGPSKANPGPSKAKPGLSKRKKLWLIIGAIVALIIIVGLVLYFTLRTPASSGPTTRTQDYTVATTTMQTTVSASGTIEPAQRSDLSFTSAGTVNAVNVAVGDTVTAGEALASIDTTSLQAAVTQAQSAVDAAQSDYNTAVSSGSSAQKTAMESTLTTKQNALANAQTALANGTLTAPFDGTVAIVNVTVGESVGSGGGGGNSGAGSNSNITNGANVGNASSSAAITVITTDTYQVTTSVSSADVGNVKAGQDCTVTPSSTTTQLKGTVESVGVIASSSTASGATFPVVIDITGAQQGLYAGVGATISIITSSRSVLTVPTSAITRQGGTEYVEVKTDSGTTQTAVQTGATSGGMTEVTSGVQAGDVVVITVTVGGSGAAASGPGAFASMFGNGGGNGQRPSGYASGAFPGGGMPTDFPTDGNFQGMQPGSGPTR